MNDLFKTLFKRLRAKSPKFFKYLTVVAAIIAMSFFGTDKIVDLSEWIPPTVLQMIYVACISVASVAQFPVSDKSKHHSDILEK